MSNDVSQTLQRKEIYPMSDSRKSEKKKGKNRLNTGIHKGAFIT